MQDGFYRFVEVYSRTPFPYRFVLNEKKIMTEYIFSCVHQTSIDSNGKVTAVEAQIRLMLGRVPAKPADFVAWWITALDRNRNTIRRLTNEKFYTDLYRISRSSHSYHFNQTCDRLHFMACITIRKLDIDDILDACELQSNKKSSKAKSCHSVWINYTRSLVPRLLYLRRHDTMQKFHTHILFSSFHNLRVNLGIFSVYIPVNRNEEVYLCKGWK